MTKAKKTSSKKRKAGVSHAFLASLSLRVKLALFLFGFLLYANTIPYDYTQDDAIAIYENMFTTQGVKGIPGLLTNDTFYGFFKVRGKSRLVQGGRYRPLTPVMFALEWQLVGNHAWLGHLINALLYGLTGILVFLVLQWIAVRIRLEKFALYFAMAGSILWIAHPLHTEAVANIKGRDEMMAFLLSMLSLWVLLKNYKDIQTRHLVLSALCLFLALLSKENAITFLVVIPLTLVFFAKYSWRKALRTTIPSFVAAVLFLVIRGQVIGWSFGDAPRELMNNPFLKIVGNQYVDFSFGERYATILYTLGKYVQLLFIPFPQTHDYYPRHIGIMHFGDWQVILSLVVYIALLVLAIRGYKTRKVWAFGILFYLITLSIVSNIVFPIGTNMSERFMYMPSLGWSIAVAAVLVLLFRNNVKTGWLVLACIALPLSVKTVTRNTTWKDNLTLFTTDIKNTPPSAKLLVATGGELITQFGPKPQTADRDAKLEKAIGYLHQAQSIHPNYKLSYLLEGNAEYYLKHWDASIKAYRNVLTIDPDDADASKNIGVAYRDGGRYFGEHDHDLPKAISYLNEALKVLPDDYETVQALGVSYGLSGDAENALKYFKRAVELAPDNAMAHYNLGLAYQRMGDVVNAQKHRDRALELDPQILEHRKSAGQ